MSDDIQFIQIFSNFMYTRSLPKIEFSKFCSHFNAECFISFIHADKIITFLFIPVIVEIKFLLEKTTTSAQHVEFIQIFYINKIFYEKYGYE